VPRLFVRREDVAGGALSVSGAPARHLAASLRVRPGERILIVDDSGLEHAVEVGAVERDRVTGRVLWSRPAGGESRLRIEVVQALVRDLEEAISALVEVGAAAVRPVLTHRSVPRPGPDRAEARLRRWREVARQAGELAHRAVVPPVHPLSDLAAAVPSLPGRSRILACVVDGAVPLARVDIDVDRPVAIVIGPEGGLDPDEVAGLRDAGAELVHLGPRVLPATRAGAFACTVLLSRSGDLEARVGAG
jgi:16S rRNA (uracil1498-N3)-methyltransferase